jgi:UDP-N-acetylmuramate: L-alanyl-gamma-D-glutamyl-meso-diaminopimelate ligase
MDPTELVAGLGEDGIAASYVPEVDDIVADIVGDAKQGDIVVVMSNGGFGGIHEKLLKGLEAR